MSPLLAALLHSLWIGALACGAAVFALRVLPVALTRLRHAVALGAVVVVFLGWGLAWALEDGWAGRFGPGPEVSFGGERSAVAPADFAPVGEVAPAEAAAARLRALRSRMTLQAWLELAWLAGAVFGLARIAVGLRVNGGRWLGGQALAPTPPEWREAWAGRVEEIAGRLEVRLAAIEARGAPFVMGFLEPVIVVPLMGCAGVTVEQARVALGHELAHVARRDWLVEVGLRAVEALLFFNPFVRLLAGRVRAEREACCDAWACEELGVPRGQYAESLLAWGRLVAPAPVGAMGLGRETGSLRARVFRLLGVKERFPARASSWRSAAAVAGLAGVAMLGYGLIVRAGARALRDQERVEVLENLSAPYVSSGFGVHAPARARPARVVSGVVVDSEGRAVAGAQVHVVTADVNETGATTDAEGRFAARRALSGAVRITVRAEGRALRVLYAEADEAELRQPIRMEPGRSVSVQVLDAKGRPLPGARVQWSHGVRALDRRDHTHADENGRATVPHLTGDTPVEFLIEAAGHAAAGVNAVRVAEHGSDNPLVVRLEPSSPVTLRVVFADDGTPVPDARARVGASAPGWSPANPYPSWSYAGLSGSPDGVVRVEHLRRDMAYRLSVGSGRAESGVVEIAPGMAGEIEVRLPRLRPLRVRLVNFPASYRGARLELSSSRTDPASGNHHVSSHPVTIDARGEGATVVRSTGTGRFLLSFADRGLRRLNVDAPSAEVFGGELVVDYEAAPPEARELRRVEVRFVHKGGRLHPAGEFHIYRFDPPNVWNFDSFSLEAGRPLFAEWPVGTRLRLARAGALVGAGVDLGSGDDDREIVVTGDLSVLEVPVKPAGMIRARALDSEGGPVRTARFHVGTEGWFGARRHGVSFESGRQLGDWKVSGPVEFGRARHAVWAGDGLVFTRGEPVRVTEANPVADVELRLPRPMRAELTFVDESGGPVPGASCRLLLRFSGPGSDAPPTALLQLASDHEGRVVFDVGEDIARWKKLELLVEAWGAGLARTGARVPVENLPAPAPIRMSPAVAFEGRVVDRATGRGIPGVRVQVYRSDSRTFPRDPGVLTNADGRFQLTDLAAGERFQLSFEWSSHLALRPPPGRKGGYVAGEDSGVVLEFEPL